MTTRPTSGIHRKYSTYASFKTDLFSGNISCLSMVDYYLSNIEKNKYLNAFIEVWSDEAKEQANIIDTKIKNGEKTGNLAGMVIAIKDNLCYKNHAVSSSSKILKGFISQYSATAIERLLAEDAIIIGRTNCDEFAMGASNETSAYGNVLNAFDNSRVAGGSSGGSAVAVQADMCMAALGSDTGGSVRQPAAFCGLVGYKPTYGMVSRWGLLAYASSFDQIGPIASSVEDVQLLMKTISGIDEFDATCLDTSYINFDEKYDKKPRIAYIKESIENEGINPEIKKQFFEKIEKLKADGIEVTPVSFEYLDHVVPCYYVLTTAEASSNLSRYQGLQFGYRSSNAEGFENTFKLSRTEGFGPEVQRRIMLGTFVLSSDQYDAYYTKAQKVRNLITQSTLKILTDFDFIIMPTTPTAAFKIGEKASNPVAMYLADIFTVQANLAGIPAISIPGGETEGMPWGLQIMGNKMQDAALLQYTKQLENIL